ncbi:glycosyl hydrolase family 76-domain-containing protein [Xylogone sp. PMI_703]|nr:glycosyl hydrolase family 76-domain-containing protein [Xylogone sp. PMI_703]
MNSMLKTSLTSAIILKTNDPANIKSVASRLAHNLMSYYTGNITNTPETIAVLPAPYYWWEAGALWGAMIDYFHYTGDDTYNNVTTQALLSQVGPEFDYMMPNHQKDEGNDDQAFWGFACMSAAEKGYPEPSKYNSSIPYTWLQLTENLWNTQVRRWDTDNCGGGLRWQIFPFNSGYTYKNSVSNGAFFQLSARLARFTGNKTYLDWAEKSFEWSQNVGFVTKRFTVVDGAGIEDNCTKANGITWTYNHGIYLYGSAIMYNYTNGSSEWYSRTNSLLSAAGGFFSPYTNSTDVMYENACEKINTCDNDQLSFKGYLARFMWGTTLMAAFTKPAITTVLSTSALAAAKTCTGGDDGVACGQKWYTGGFDNHPGIGQQMSALEVVQGLLVAKSVPPLYGSEVQIAAEKPTPRTAPTSRSLTLESENPTGSSTIQQATVPGDTSKDVDNAAVGSYGAPRWFESLLATVLAASLTTSFLL